VLHKEFFVFIIRNFMKMNAATLGFFALLLQRFMAEDSLPANE